MHTGFKTVILVLAFTSKYWLDFLLDHIKNTKWNVSGQTLQNDLHPNFCCKSETYSGGRMLEGVVNLDLSRRFDSSFVNCLFIFRIFFFILLLLLSVFFLIETLTLLLWQSSPLTLFFALYSREVKWPAWNEKAHLHVKKTLPLSDKLWPPEDLWRQISIVHH